jgi:hypothetical protein
LHSGYQQIISESIKQKPNTFAHEIQVNTPGKTLVGKPVLSLIVLLKILGSRPGIMAHQRITMLQLIE